MSITIHGQVAPGFEAVAEAMKANFEAGNEIGAAFTLFEKGEKTRRYLGRPFRPRPHEALAGGHADPGLLHRQGDQRDCGRLGRRSGLAVL